MLELLPITVFSVFFVVLSHKYSGYDPIEGRYQRKERLFYVIMAVGMIVFAGLRTGYNDTYTYHGVYQNVVKNVDEYKNLADGIDWLKIGKAPGFEFTMRVMAKLNFSSWSFTMAFTAFYMGVHLWFFRKYSCNLWLSVLLYITFAGFTFALAAIKQCTAVALCLIATDRAINKKYIQFVLLVAVACLFHAYSWMYLAVPFLFFRPWSKNTLIMLVVFGVIGFSMESLLGSLLNVTDMLGGNYSAESFNGEGVNPFRLLVVAVPVFLSLLTVQQIEESQEKDQYLMVNLAMLNAEIMFVGLFGTANYFARLANYFIPFQVVSIPWLLKHYDYESRRTLTILAVAGYVMIFIYENVILGNFDMAFARTTLWRYLQSLL